MLSFLNRILLACIKYLGKCLCPTCLVKKNEVPNLGTKPDMKIRKEQKRKDDESCRHAIEQVRKWMFERGMDVESKHVDKVLGPRSLVPTRVRP